MSALLLSALLAATPAEDAAVKRATAALDPFKKTLKETLVKALEKGPEAAIEVCAKDAPELARAASKDGVTVGRSGLKLRNPKNAPKPWVEKAMTELSRADAGVPSAKVVTLPDGAVGYAEAIWTAPMCLTCHGEPLAPQVDAKLKAAYPKDTARGFKPNDFRGVFWAEVK